MFEEMKREESKRKEKKSSNLSSFIQNLVSKSSDPQKASKDVASMFPTTVRKEKTTRVQETVEFAGEMVTVEREVKKESEEGKKMLKKNNLDDLVSRLTGKSKGITTLSKTEHDWNKFKKNEGIE
eukprot:600466-Hanusia_phi.AAC.1